MKITTQHSEPDYSGGLAGPSGKKPKMKKVHPQITLRNIPPAMHAKMRVGKKIKAHVTMMPVAKSEGQSSPWGEPDGDENANHVTMEMHSMEPEMEPDADDQPQMKTAGAALQEFMDKKKKASA